jgi:hypothetical protein
VRRVAHRLHAAGDGDVDLAERDRARRAEHGLETRAANLVDRHCRNAVGQPGIPQRLARGRLTDGGLEHVAHVNELDVARRDLGAFERGLDRGRTELGSRHAGERAEETTDGGARGTDDHDVTHALGIPRTPKGRQPVARMAP